MIENLRRTQLFDDFGGHDYGCQTVIVAVVMGLRQFKSDLAAAKTASIDRVSGICNGDSDGEVVFNYSFEDIAPVEVRALATGKHIPDSLVKKLGADTPRCRFLPASIRVLGLHFFRGRRKGLGAFYPGAFLASRGQGSR